MNMPEGDVIEPTSTQMIQETQQVQTGVAPVELAEPTTDPALPQGAEPVVEDPNTIEVDGRRFASEKDAFEYMKQRVGQVETEKMIEQARVQGMQEALYSMPQGQSVAPEVTEQPVDMDKFYENPAEFLAERDKKLREQLRQEVTQTNTAQQREAETWRQFSTKFPDLSDYQEDVNAVVAKHHDTVAAIARTNPDKAMDYVAMKTREKFQNYIEALKPTRTLANTKTGPSVGGNPPVTQTTNTTDSEKPVDFVAQMRSIRRK